MGGGQCLHGDEDEDWIRELLEYNREALTTK
jgi:hypothetical protein